MPIDIDMIRPEKGGDHEIVRRSEMRRFRSDDCLNRTIAFDKEWRVTLFQLEMARKATRSYQKVISVHYKGGGKKQSELSSKENPVAVAQSTPNTEEPSSCVDLNSWTESLASIPVASLPAAESLLPSQLKALLAHLKERISGLEISLSSLASKRKDSLFSLGNIVHEDVPTSNDEADNKVLKTWGFTRTDDLPKKGSWRLHHHQILTKLGALELKKGAEVAGHRGYFLKGCGVLLNMALVNYGLSFLVKKGYLPVQPPYMMRKEVMKDAAELKEFDETLYHVAGGGSLPGGNITSNANNQEKASVTIAGNDQEKTSNADELYLIATSEQPLCAMNRGETFEPKDLPIRYAGISTCFRKEAGSHGRDTWGIFRVHQFEKVEQFCITTPEESSKMHKEMLQISEEFYRSLKLPFRVISIVSGALNDAAASKFDLEAWFPAYEEFKELVSCSNCTDYQSRALDIYLGYQAGALAHRRSFVHMLNGTLVASQRCLCCIVENYQEEGGVRVPEVLVPFVGSEFFKYSE